MLPAGAQLLKTSGRPAIRAEESSATVPAMASGSEQREQAVALLDHPPAEGFLSQGAAEAYTTDGSLDLDGNPALKQRTGGWRACRTLLAIEFCYNLSINGITCNLITYLTVFLGMGNVAAARSVSTWQATSSVIPLAGAILADSYWGRYRTRVISFSTFAVGMILTALSAYLPLLVKNGISNVVSVQEFILFLGLYIIAVGVGGLRPCLMSFGADQFDDGDPLERRAKGPFFNWYVFTMYCGSTIASTGIVWVQDHYGWALGPTILAAVLAGGLSCLVATSHKYRFQPTRGSPLTGVCQVVVAAVRNFNVQLPSDSSLLYELPEDNPVMKGFERIEHTTDLQFFDKAAIVAPSNKEVEEADLPALRGPWRLCAVTQVEELKILVRMLPLLATIVFFYAVAAQVPSTFVEQGMAMDTTVGSARIPSASMSTFNVLTIVVLIPLYDRVFVPVARRLTGRENGISGLQRIGAGLAMPVLSMGAAAFLETARLRAAKASPRAPNGTSVLWQVPQYALEGVGQVLTTVGQFSFFYSQAPPAMKTVCTALGLLSIAAGEYLSSLLLTAVQWATATGGAPGWIPDDLNEGHLDRFFWMMAGLGCLNLMAFVSCAMRYKSRKAKCQRCGSNFVDNR
ncbi:protein NRT1/ PTR FAMILY 8.3-like [Triticum dicoccoides]|uniref:protein NRT1/ PTR FAMILY 8.3-like n=1 Tax=Triticum dicoccoides TaxID=85692 RepID=UPI001891C3FE|nr:protein NRT1/ PTR FAMILY 8.3-like [Triticum dicoccoides]